MRTPCFRLAAVLAALAALSAAPSPLLGQASDQGGTAGRFVWADLFTGDAASASAFYTQLLGWTAETRQHGDRTFIVLSNGGQPVAAVVQRRNSGTNRLARWVDYIDVSDAGAAISAATASGGRVLAPLKTFSRGSHAVIADNEGAVIGIRQAKSGSARELSTSQAGDWAWFELFARDPQASAQFYTKVFNYGTAPDDKTQNDNHLVLTTGQNNQAGIQPMPAGDDNQPDWLGFVQVADIDATIAHVAGLGGEVITTAAPADTGSRYAVISDPTGGTIGIVQYLAAHPSNPTIPTTPLP